MMISSNKTSTSLSLHTNFLVLLAISLVLNELQRMQVCRCHYQCQCNTIANEFLQTRQCLRNAAFYYKNLKF